MLICSNTTGTYLCSRPHSEACEAFANLGLVVVFLAIAIASNKFMLARNTVLRNKHFGVLPVVVDANSPPLAVVSSSTPSAPLLEAGSVTWQENGTFPLSTTNRSSTPNRSQKSKRAQQKNSKSKHACAFPIGDQSTKVPAAADMGRESMGSSMSSTDAAERDLEASAEQNLDEQRAVEVDLGRFIKDGTMVFFLLTSLYALIMVIITLFLVLTLSPRFPRTISNGLDDLLTVFPVMFYYGIIACLCEKLFSLTDIILGRSRATKRLRRLILVLVSELPNFIQGVGYLASQSPVLQSNLPYTDIFCAVVLSTVLAVAGFTATKTEGAGSNQQRSLCVRVSFFSIVFILVRATATLPYVQDRYLNDKSLLFQHFIFNIGIVVPIACSLLILKVRWPVQNQSDVVKEHSENPLRA